MHRKNCSFSSVSPRRKTSRRYGTRPAAHAAGLILEQDLTMLIKLTSYPMQFRSFFQGCGGIISGGKHDRIKFLTGVEMSKRNSGKLSHMVEPKADGIWVSLISNRHGNVCISTKTRSVKIIEDMEHLSMLPNSVVVGELSSGSQQSRKDVEEHGNSFVKVFDIVKFAGNDTTTLTLLKRKVILQEFIKKMAESYPDSLKFILEMPMKSSGLVQMYNEQPEGVIAKEIDDGPYVCGSRNSCWIKVKKCFCDDYIILGWERSTAATKKYTKMAKNMVVGGWVPCGEVTLKDKVYASGKIGSMDCKLIGLMRVGAMTDAMSISLAYDFAAKWKGRVVRIGHYKLFKSGAGRHPFVMEDENGLAMLSEYGHTACFYRIAERLGGKEI